MLDNELYNLLVQIVQENKSLWRIENMYQGDAQGCGKCSTFWTKMKTDKAEHVAELKALIKDHLNQ